MKSLPSNQKPKISRIGTIEEYEGVKYPMGWAFEGPYLTVDTTGDVPRFAGYTVEELQEIVDNNKGS